MHMTINKAIEQVDGIVLNTFDTEAKFHWLSNLDGMISRVIMDYVRDMEEELMHAKPDRVFITHSGCEQEDIDAVRAYLQGLNHFEEILITRAGSVISSHCGPGTLGVLFISEK